MTLYQTQCLDGGPDGEDDLLVVGEGLLDLLLLLQPLLRDGEGAVPALRAGDLTSTSESVGNAESFAQVSNSPHWSSHLRRKSVCNF